MRIYLDTCCLNRPADDLSIVRNRVEADIILGLISLAEAGELTLVTSDYVALELNEITDVDRREKVLQLHGVVDEVIAASEAIGERARELVSEGLTTFDAMHVASAESANCDYLVTADDRIIKKIGRLDVAVSVRSPTQWLDEVDSS